MTRARYRLGAIELIELGRQGEPRGGRPFLAQGRPARVGDALSSAGVFLADALSAIVGVLADIVEIPTAILASGVDVVFTNIAAVLAEIPLLGEIVSQAVLAAGAILKFAIQVPHLALEGVANLFEGLSDALDSNYAPSDRQRMLSEARERITSQAPENARPQVQRMLTSDREVARDPGAGDDLGKVLAVGVPAAIAAGAVAIAAFA